MFFNVTNNPNNKIVFKAKPPNILTLKSALPEHKPKVAFSWSGGKDSTLALFKLIQSGKFDIVSLFSNISEQFHRVSLSGIRESLAEKQADSIGIPLRKIFMNDDTYESYNATMARTFEHYKEEGVDIIAYGDITRLERFQSPDCLSTIRANQLNALKMKALFPLTTDSEQSLNDFIRNGFRSVVTCIDSRKLDESFLGCIIDKKFKQKLPRDVDPSGEHGEYHSFAFDGPLFRQKIDFAIGEKMKQDGNIFCDIVPLEK